MPFLHLFILDLYPKLYPELSQYMGLTLNEEEICTNMPVVSGAPTQGVRMCSIILSYITCSLCAHVHSHS